MDKISSSEFSKSLAFLLLCVFQIGVQMFALIWLSDYIGIPLSSEASLLEISLAAHFRFAIIGFINAIIILIIAAYTKILIEPIRNIGDNISDNISDMVCGGVGYTLILLLLLKLLFDVMCKHTMSLWNRSKSCSM
jgi:hypothetical protein